jgi:CheY-like chemotaxis protein
MPDCAFLHLIETTILTQSADKKTRIIPVNSTNQARMTKYGHFLASKGRRCEAGPLFRGRRAAFRLGIKMLGILSMANSLAPNNDRKTILLATDNPEVLQHIGASLVENNYHVLLGHSGAEALEQEKKYKLQIDLLLSAFDMEGVNGLSLAAQVCTRWPDLKVLLMSEFRGGTLVLNGGWHFLPKPFVSSQLNALILTLLNPAGTVPSYQRPGYPPSAKAATFAAPLTLKITTRSTTG